MFDLPAVQGTLKSLLQHHSSKASILQCSASFMVQLSYLYMSTGETIALAIWAFVSKVMSLLSNMLSRLASLVAQLVKNPPAMWETWVRSLGREVLLKKGMGGFPAPLPLSPFYPPDLDRRVDSPALSGRGSRPSGRTSG